MRLSSLILCASVLACAMAQTTTTTTVPQPTPTTAPPTTEPPPPNDYTLKDKDDKTCLRMVANITVKFDYANKTTGMPISYNYSLIDAHAVVDTDQSQCPTELVLRFDPTEDEGDVNYVTFSFMQTSDGKAWTSEMVQYNFTVTNEEFPDSEFIGRALSYTATNKLLDANVDLEGSYKCNANQDIMFDSSATEYKLNLTLAIVELHVQAYFNGGKESFDTATECAADNGSKGNKIVPIAVGAALAGLVIVVLIAYLIGRLKSRRQSSYEALS